MFLKNHKRWTALFLTAILLCFSVKAVHADGTTSIALSGNSVEVGKKVTVTVTGSDASKLSLRYNNNALKFVSCSASGFTTDANTISFSGKTATVTFEAQDSGAGDLVVSSDVLSGSSATVQVTKPQAAEPEPKPEEEPKQEEPKEQQSEEDNSKKDTSAKSNASKKDGDFTIDGKEYVLSERYQDKEIPSGFTRKTMKIHGGTYRELSNGKVTLVYLKPADKIEGSGEFYVYDADADNVTPYKVLGTAGYYLTVSKADEIPQTLEKTKLKVQKKEYTLYRVKGQDNDFYYVYGTDQDGNKGWYCYDSLLGTIQRANMDLLSGMAVAADQDQDEAQESKPEGKRVPKEKGQKSELDKIVKNFGGSRNVMAVGIFVGVVLLIIILDVLLFRRKIKDEDDDYEDEPEEEEPTEVLQVDHILEAEDFEEANKPHKSRKFLKREKPKDIWDTKDKVFSDDTSELPMIDDESSKLKKQVFRGRSQESGSEGEEGKVDVIDFNDL